MRRTRNGLVASIVLVVLAGVVGRADEEKVALNKVPKAAIEAVKAKFEGAKLVSASTEKADGKVVYEISLKHKGHNVDVTVTADGKIVSCEKSIDAKELPKAVRQAVKAKYPKAKIKLAEEITEGEKISYEVLLATADKTEVEVVLDPEGKILKEEKKGKKE